MWDRDREKKNQRERHAMKRERDRLRQRDNSVLRPSAWPAAGPDVCTMSTGTS